MESFQQLGRYLLVERIASGGMADVYRGKLLGVEGFEKDVAIKKILPHWVENQEFIDMLVDEAKVLLHLTHANIVQVYELNKEGNTYYIVMEYVDGIDLRKVTGKLAKTERLFPIALVAYVGRQIAAGLEFAHERTDRHSKPLGIVHRDVSPQNILLSADGEVKITDFGIAKVLGKTTETVTGTLKGKFAYMSPEQAMGEAVDHRTDIFALGIILYELATGTRCFKGTNDMETLESVKKADVAFPEQTLTRIPGSVKKIILKALRKKREERYQSASELRRDLAAVESALALSVSGSDLKAFLYDLFPERFSHRREREEDLSAKTRLHLKTQVGRPKTKILVGGASPDLPQTVLDGLSRIKKRKVKIAWGGAGAMVIVALVWWGSGFLKKSDDEPKTVTFVPIKEEVKMPEPVEIPKPVPIVEPIVAPPPPQKSGATGGLSVSARPWGRVTLPGVFNAVETPMTRQVPEGDYVMKVSYPPDNKSVTAEVTIKPGNTVRCQAAFGDSPRITCR
ncbi:MAG: serine/threonine-protein kinase [Deltaproteobacteria bacterium]|nr:serine/threonine-protein kinase [Deltaproteobacteria bacterium]